MNAAASSTKIHFTAIGSTPRFTEVVGIGPFTGGGGNLAIFRSRAAAEEFVKQEPLKLASSTVTAFVAILFGRRPRRLGAEQDRPMDETELEELRELAQRLHPAAEVREQSCAGPHSPLWSLTIEAEGTDPVEVRCPDRARARRSIKTTLIELLGERGLLRPPDVDAPIFADESADYEGAYTDLANVLESAQTEEDIQKCLERHPEVWYDFLTSTKPQVIPKMPLGHDFVTDFVVFGAAPWSQMQRPTATFVEIERADVPLFTAKGDPSAALTHGQRQLHNWRQWIRDNKQQVRDYMLDKTYLNWERHGFEGQPAGLPAFGFEDRYLLVIGRRSSMTPAQRWQLHQICEDFPKTVTYDVLLEVLCPEAPNRLPWLYWDRP